MNQTYAHLASIADKAGVCGAGGNRLIVLHDSKFRGTLLITDSLGSKASRLEPVQIGDCSGSASARRLYLLLMPADVGSTHSTAGRANETSAARPALSAPCDADVPCLEGYAVGEGDDVVRFVGSPTNDAECLEDGLLDPQQPVGTDIVGGELCQIAYQAAALNYLYIADLAGSEARCLNGQVDNPNSGASDALQLGICATAGAATGSVGNVQTDLYQTEAEAQCIAGQTTNPNPNAPDPIGSGACGEVGTAVEGADSTAGAAAGILTSDAGKLSLEFQCLENAVQYPTPGVPDPLGTGLCGDVGTAVSDTESGAATVVSTAESGVGQLAGALAAAAGQVGLEFQCLQNALQYPTPGVPDPLGTGICGDVGTAVFDTESGVNAALSVAGQIPGVVASAAGQVGLEFQCLQNALQYPTPGVPDPLGTGICGDVGTAVFDGEAGAGAVVSAAGQIPGVLASAAGELGLEFQCLQNAVQYPTPGVPDPLGTGICGDVGTAVFDAESGAGAAVSTAESAAGQIAGALASASGKLGLEFQCLQNAVQYPTPGVTDPLGTGLCGDVGTGVFDAESGAGEALSAAGQIPGALASAAGELGPEFQCLENAVLYPNPGVPDPLGTGLCGDVGAVGGEAGQIPDQLAETVTAAESAEATAAASAVTASSPVTGAAASTGLASDAFNAVGSAGDTVNSALASAYQGDGQLGGAIGSVADPLTSGLPVDGSGTPLSPVIAAVRTPVATGVSTASADLEPTYDQALSVMNQPGSAVAAQALESTAATAQALYAPVTDSTYQVVDAATSTSGAAADVAATADYAKPPEEFSYYVYAFNPNGSAARLAAENEYEERGASEEAQDDTNKQGSVVILSFGSQGGPALNTSTATQDYTPGYTIEKSGNPSLAVTDPNTNYISYTDIQNLAEAYIEGYARAANERALKNPGYVPPVLTLGIGTTNDRADSATWGEAWAAQVVAPITNWTTARPRFDKFVNIDGADDIEPGFDTRVTPPQANPKKPAYGVPETDAIDWVDSYASHVGSPFIDYGAQACIQDGNDVSGPSFYKPNYHNPRCGTSSTDVLGWDEEVQYDLSDGINPADDPWYIKVKTHGTPQIYNDNQSEQWAETAHYAAVSQTPYSLLGVLDQGGYDGTFSNSAAWSDFVSWIKRSSATRTLVPAHSMTIGSD